MSFVQSVLSIFLLFLLCEFSIEDDVIGGIYYRGSWKHQEGEFFHYSEFPNEGYMEMVLENSTLMYTDPNMTLPFTFVVGYIGIRLGMYAGTEQELLYLYGLMSPDRKHLYSYIFDSGTYRDRMTHGNPAKASDSSYPYKDKEPLSPTFTPRNEELDQNVYKAFEVLFQQFQMILSDEGFEYEIPSHDAKRYVYKTVFEIEPVDNVEEEVQTEFEELRRIGVVYRLKGTMMGISQPCKGAIINVLMETKIPQDRYREILHYVILMSCLTGIGLASLIYQIDTTASPSHQARVSYHGIGLLVLIDGYYFLFHLVACLSKWKGCFFMMSIVSFLHVVSFFGLEMKYFLNVWKATNGVGGGRTWRQVRRGMSSIYGRYYIIFFVGLFMLIKYPSSLKYLALLLFSIWVPQIIHNVYYDIKKSVNMSYIFFQSIAKCSVISYFYLYPYNFLMVEQDILYVLLLLFYVFVVQCGTLVVQRIVGGRFYFFKICMGQKRYDYKKPIPDDLLESGDCSCAICLEVVQRDVGDHMVTPCNHIFHEPCLRRWSEEKLECPVCRAALPFLNELDD